MEAIAAAGTGARIRRNANAVLAADDLDYVIQARSLRTAISVAEA
jgi:hypothetical protein